MSKLCLPTILVNATRLLPHIEYWRSLRSSRDCDFTGHSMRNCIDVIHADIIYVWNLLDSERVCLFFYPGCLHHLGESALVEQSI